MPSLRASEAAAVTGGHLVGPDAAATGLVADSREVRPGVAFAAIATGNRFIGDAVAAGAPFVVVERDSDVGSADSAVVVGDSVRALADVAAMVHHRRDAFVVGITGSVGKTLTKDFLAAALGASMRVHATPRSFNAEIGVPLTLLSAPDDVDALVIELAARHVGEIAELCEIVRPHAGVITGIGTTHVEEFGSRDAIARTKAELLAALPSDGFAVVPSGDDYLDLLVSSTQARVMTVGSGGMVRYRSQRIDAAGRTHGVVMIGAHEIDIVLPVAGRALLRNAAMAIAVAVERGVDPSAAARAIGETRPSAWRMQLTDVDGRTVVNDAYNSNPTSLASSLRAAKELAGTRPAWAVLGAMAELGDATETEHRRAGRLAAGLGYAGVVVVGRDARAIADGAGAIAGVVGSLAEAVDAIRERVPSDAVVVVKASRVAGLERLVDELARSGDPERERAV